MLRFLIPMLLLLVFPDAYIWRFFTRQQPGVWRTIVLLLPTVATVLFLVLTLCHVRASLFMQWAFVLLICVAMPKLVFTVFDIVGRTLVWNNTAALPWAHRIAVVLAVVTAGAQVYGTAWGWQRLTVKHRTVTIDNLPTAFRGYRIVQISDLHLGTYAGNTRLVASLVDSVNSLQPDLIVFTGDIVNAASAEAEPFVATLSQLRAKDGVFAILGNHDYCMYQPGITADEQRREVRRVVEAERAMGWDVLLNEHRIISRGNDSLCLTGVENVGKPPFPERGNLSRALQGVPSSTCTVLLSHDPWHWRHGVTGKQPVALTLSGHTHALQMQIGNFSPASWFMPEWGGLYKEGKQQLYVSTGIGGSVPYRLGAWPAIDVLTLE